MLEAGFRPPDLFFMQDACHIKKLCAGLFFPQSIERPARVREFISWNPAEELIPSVPLQSWHEEYYIYIFFISFYELIL